MYKKLYFNLTLLFVIALIFSRFALSVLMIGMSLAAIMATLKNEKGSPESWGLKALWQHKEVWGLVLVFLAVAISGINTENTYGWVDQMRVKLPFVFLPMVFFVFKEVKPVHHEVMHRMLLAVMVTSTIGVLWNYISDYENINRSIGYGKSIPTPIDHIHYGIFLAYSVVSAFIFMLWHSERTQKLIYGILGMYLFVFAHFLAVRTGLVLCYAGLALVAMWYVIKHRQWKMAVLAVVLSFAVPYTAYKTLPTLNKKIGYMLYDIKQFKKGKGNNYSDSERLMSYSIAIDLLKEKPLLGHGIGDLHPMMKERHVEKYGEKEKYIYPHNQYLFILASMGLLGAALFFLGVLSPILFARERNIFLVVLTAMMLISFLVENTVQRAIITAFFLFFMLMNLRVGKNTIADR